MWVWACADFDHHLWLHQCAAALHAASFAIPFGGSIRIHPYTHAYIHPSNHPTTMRPDPIRSDHEIKHPHPDLTTRPSPLPSDHPTEFGAHRCRLLSLSFIHIYAILWTRFTYATNTYIHTQTYGNTRPRFLMRPIHLFGHCSWRLMCCVCWHVVYADVLVVALAATHKRARHSGVHRSKRTTARGRATTMEKS